MTDYRALSTEEAKRVDKDIRRDVPIAHHKNEHNGFEWDEPLWTLQQVHNGDYCAKCWRSWYTCLCSHDD